MMTTQRFFDLSRSTTRQPKAQKDGTVLVEEGEQVSQVFLLLHGAVEITAADTASDRLCLGVLRGPAILGATELLAGTDAVCSYVALGPVSGVWISEAEFAEMCDRDSQLWRDAVSQGAHERRLAAETALLMRDDAEVRLGRLLCGYAHAVGRREGSHMRLLVRRSQRAFAAACGLTERHANRVFGRWQQSGILRKEGGNLVIDCHRAQKGRLPIVA